MCFLYRFVVLIGFAVSGAFAGGSSELNSDSSSSDAGNGSSSTQRVFFEDALAGIKAKYSRRQALPIQTLAEALRGAPAQFLSRESKKIPRFCDRFLQKTHKNNRALGLGGGPVPLPLQAPDSLHCKSLTLAEALGFTKFERNVSFQDAKIEKSPLPGVPVADVPVIDVKVKKKAASKKKKKTVRRKKPKIDSSDELTERVQVGKKRKRASAPNKKSKRGKYQEVDFDDVKFWRVDPLDSRFFQLLGENNEVLFSDQVRIRSGLRQLAPKNRLRIKYNNTSSAYIDHHPDDDLDLKASGFAVKEEVIQGQDIKPVGGPEPIEYSDDLMDATVIDDFYAQLEEGGVDIASFLENEKRGDFVDGF